MEYKVKYKKEDRWFVLCILRLIVCESYNCETEDYISFAIKNLMVIIEAIPIGASWKKFGIRLFSDFILKLMIVVYH